MQSLYPTVSVFIVADMGPQNCPTPIWLSRYQGYMIRYSGDGETNLLSFFSFFFCICFSIDLFRSWCVCDSLFSSTRSIFFSSEGNRHTISIFHFSGMVKHAVLSKHLIIFEIHFWSRRCIILLTLRSQQFYFFFVFSIPIEVKNQVSKNMNRERSLISFPGGDFNFIFEKLQRNLFDSIRRWNPDYFFKWISVYCKSIEPTIGCKFLDLPIVCSRIQLSVRWVHSKCINSFTENTFFLIFIWIQQKLRVNKLDNI